MSFCSAETRNGSSKAEANHSAAVVETVSEQPPMTYLTNPVTVAGMTPKTRDDIAIRDAVRKALADVEVAVAEFVAEKTAEGFSLAEIDQLFVLELPLIMAIRSDNGRVRASYDARIIDRQA